MAWDEFLRGARLAAGQTARRRGDRAPAVAGARGGRARPRARRHGRRLRRPRARRRARPTRASSVRDVALATELVYGTLRWQRYLDWILAPHSRRRLASLDSRVRVLLRLTAYQLAFLERVPAFAAVNDAVTLARAKPGVAEYVNARPALVRPPGHARARARAASRPAGGAGDALLVSHVARRAAGSTRYGAGRGRGAHARAERAAGARHPRQHAAGSAATTWPRACARKASTAHADAPGARGRRRRGRRRSRALARLRGRPVRRAGRGLDARGAPAGAGGRRDDRRRVRRARHQDHPSGPAHGQSRPGARARSAGRPPGPRRRRRPRGSA